MTRQRQWQIRMRAEGRCTKCGASAAPSRQQKTGTYCETHRRMRNENYKTNQTNKQSKTLEEVTLSD